MSFELLLNGTVGMRMRAHGTISAINSQMETNVGSLSFYIFLDLIDLLVSCHSVYQVSDSPVVRKMARQRSKTPSVAKSVCDVMCYEWSCCMMT